MLPLDFIRSNAKIFARVGSVVASYRTRDSTRYGPYYRVAYRIGDRQRSIYLGRCKRLADRARALLAKLQQPRDYRRMCRKAERQRRATLRQVIRGWQRTIRAYGLDLRGCEIRGWRRLGIPRFDKTTPYTAAQKAAAAIFRKPPPVPPTDPRYWQNPSPVDQLPVAWLSRAETRSTIDSPTSAPTTQYWQNRPSVDQLGHQAFHPIQPHPSSAQN